MKVVGAGFSRTGTASLKIALETLGFGPCYHMAEVTGSLRRARQWLVAATGYPDWDAIFTGYGSSVDWPAAAFWRELAAHYPESKVILTVRDPGQWYTSAAATIFRSAAWTNGPLGRTVSAILLFANPKMRDIAQMFKIVVRERVFNGSIHDREHAVEVFRQYIREVKESISPQRLLVFDSRMRRSQA